MKNIGFIGTGNMAKAMIKGLKNSKLKFNIYGFDKDAKILAQTEKEYGIKIKKSNEEVVKVSDIIILAVKPQNMNEVLNELADKITEKHLIISIAAGIKINFIMSKIGKKIPVVRVMPNTPALIGEGACAYSENKYVSHKDKFLIKNILFSFCKIAIKLPENKINAITALSGSGPAYFFYFIEAMLNAAFDLKINNKIAFSLLSQTMIGAGKMLLYSNTSPQELRKKVTSKGGTTERAIEFMEKKRLKDIIKKAIHLAKKRADELSAQIK